MRAAPALLLLAACATSHLSEHAYPTDFKYLTNREVNGAMERMARSTYALNELLRRDGELSATERQTVERLLQELDEASAQLDTQGIPTNHPTLDQYLPRFRREVAQAREAVRRDPPNYYLAGAVTQSCLLCHSQGVAR